MRTYEIGRKKILRKAEIKNLSSPVNTIQTSGKRIFVTELCDSFHMYTYKEKEQTFYDIADDVLPRYVTTACNLDAYTMIGADKF
jgi:splicing factor 3B subunit 3